MEEKQLQYGDKIFLYTDGVLDRSNSAGEFFGKQRFYTALQQYGDRPVQNLVDCLMRVTKDFAGDAKSKDDISLMVIEYG